VTASLAWTRATFESHAELASPLVEEPDSTAPPPPPGTPPHDEGAVEVEPGDLFPMVPQLTGSLAVRYRWGPTSLELEGEWTGSQFLIGDEGNEEEFDRIAASTILDARAERQVGRTSVFVEVANVLDTEYNAYGMISENGRAAIEEVERFLTPGAPRRLTVGARVSVFGP
jgi:outer membrane receptor protein involved in Fe transport